MIFNTTAGDLQLNSGAVSKSIYQAAGPVIQAEVLQQCPRGLKVGRMVVSSGGALNCSHIYHTVLCNWDGGAGQAQQVIALEMQMTNL